MAKKDQFYFDNFVTSADYACKASRYLIECLSDYNPNNIKAMMETMHELEHAGDSQKHEMTAALAKAFVTPVDREDLALMSQNIDDVIDSIDEVLQRFYMYGIISVKPDAVEFARKINTCCELLSEMLSEFTNFRKSDKLHNMIIDINQKEEECDGLYLHSVRELHEKCSNVLEIISWSDIFDKLENCADSCEHVADCVELVVMKNS